MIALAMEERQGAQMRDKPDKPDKPDMTDRLREDRHKLAPLPRSMDWSNKKMRTSQIVMAK